MLVVLIYFSVEQILINSKEMIKLNTNRCCRHFFSFVLEALGGIG
jgi:hypothetical protein